jgi:hypothetical protein
MGLRRRSGGTREGLGKRGGRKEERRERGEGERRERRARGGREEGERKILSQLLVAYKRRLGARDDVAPLHVGGRPKTCWVFPRPALAPRVLQIATSKRTCRTLRCGRHLPARLHFDMQFEINVSNFPLQPPRPPPFREPDPEQLLPAVHPS